MTKLVIVGTERGGDGKSTLTVMLASMMQAAGAEYFVIDADDTGRLAADGDVTRLGQVLKQHRVVWIGVGPDAVEIEANPDVLNTHWDKVGKIAAEYNAIIDLGANTVQRLCQYADPETGMDLGTRWGRRGVEIECWVPFTCDDESYSKGVKTLRRLKETIRGAKIVGVRNGLDGDLWNKPESRELQALQKQGVVVVDMPKCMAPPAVWDAMKAAKIGPFEAVSIGEADLAAALGYPVNESDPVARAQVRIEQWIASLYKSWKGLVPEVLPGK